MVLKKNLLMVIKLSKTSKVKTTTNKIKSEPINDEISKDIIFYVLYLFIALLPQYFKGGYFEDIYIPFNFFMGIFMLSFIYKRYKGTRNILIKSGEDLYLLAMTLIYGLSFFYGINKRGSIIEFIKYLGFISVFLISRDLHRDKKRRGISLDIIILSGLVLSIIGIGTMIGTWDYAGSFVGGRLSSTFQYPNTLAVYVAFMYFLTMGQALIEEKPIKIGIYGIGLNIFFSALIFTYSRGMWLIFPLVLLLYFILLSTRKKVVLFFYTLGSLLVSLPFSFLFLKFMDGETASLWGLYIGGMLLSGFVLFILGKSKVILKKISVKTAIVITITLAIIGAIVLGVFINTTVPQEYKYIPENIVTRILGISSSDNSLQARLIFSKDALKLAKKGPILGSGGSSWITSYRSVQSYPYWSKQVHNHFLQVLVEIGMLGLLLFLGVLVSLGYKYIIFKRSDRQDSEKTMADTLIITCFTILAHAFIDFDFSLTGYYVVFWILLGMLSSMVTSDKGEINIFSLKLDKSFLKKVSILVPVLSMIGILLSGTMYAGINYHEKALDAEWEDDMDLAEKYMKKSTSLDPYNTDYKEDLVRVYLDQYYKKDDNSYGSMAKEEVDETLKIGKKDPLVYIKATESYFKFGLIDEGIGLINRALELQPLVMETYLQNTNIYTSTFNHYIEQGELSKAEELAKEGYKKIHTSLINANKRSIRPMSKNNEVFFELSQLKYYSENMDDFLSHFQRGLRLKYVYAFDLDVDDDGKLELISTWNAAGGELAYEIQSEKDSIRLENPGLEYGVLDSVGLNLQPNTTYTVSFDAKGDMDMEKVTFYILDTKAEEQIQTDSIKIDLNSEYQTYEYEFTTHGDVGENTSRFRFVIGGENEGYMDLHEIRIFENINQEK